MATELSLLIPEFRKKLIETIEATKKRGFHIETLITLVTPVEQASRWRQGRSVTDAELKTMALTHAGAPYLSECMSKSRAKETNVMTDDLPGCSWHQWGEAATIVWVDGNRKLNHSPVFKERPSNQNGYVVFAEEAVKLGLYMGHFNRVQFRAESSPTNLYDLRAIDAEMRKRFGR